MASGGTGAGRSAAAVHGHDLQLFLRVAVVCGHALRRFIGCGCARPWAVTVRMGFVPWATDVGMGCSGA